MKNSTFKDDGLSKIDLLGRKKHAESLADSIIQSISNDSESFAIGITGKWGSGKSNFLYYIKKVIEKKRKDENIEFAEFLPWSANPINNLESEFYKLLSNTIGSKEPELRKRLNSLHKFSSKYLNNLPISPLGKIFLNGTKRLVEESIKSPSAEESKLEINKYLRENNLKLIITIDEVDRLEPEQIFELFKIVKANCNYINTRYIICYDKEQINSVLSEKFKLYGENYLEKIIQLEYPIPHVTSNNLLRVFIDSLKKIEYNFQFDFKYIESAWNYYGLKDIIENIRDIKRISNSLFIRLSVIKTDINVNDFLLLESIRLTNPSDYQKIYFGIRSEILFNYGTEDSNSNWRNTLSSSYIRQIVEFLQKQIPTYRYSKESNKHIFEQEYFERYFTLAVSPDEVLDKEIEGFLYGKEEQKDKLLNHFNSNKKLENFFVRLGNPNLDINLKLLQQSILYYLINIESKINFDFNLSKKLISAILNLLFKINPTKPFLSTYLIYAKGDIENKAIKLFLIDEILYLFTNKWNSVLENKNDPRLGLVKKIFSFQNEIKDSFNILKLEFGHYYFNRGFFNIENIDYTFMDFLIYNLVKDNPFEYSVFIEKLLKNSNKNLIVQFGVFLVEKRIIIWDQDKPEKIYRIREHFKESFGESFEKIIDSLISVEKSYDYTQIQKERVLNFLDYIKEKKIKLD